MKSKDKKGSGHADKKKKKKDRMVRVGGENIRRGARHLRCDDIPTDTFTPRTYQVELLESALQGNTIACLGSESSKLFLGLMVLRQLAHQIRPPLHLGGKRSVYLVNSEEDVEMVWNTLFHHTDLAVGRVSLPDTPQDPLQVEPSTPEVGSQVTCGAIKTEDVPSKKIKVAIEEDKIVSAPEEPATPLTEEVLGKPDTLQQTAASDTDQKVSNIPQEEANTPCEIPVAPEDHGTLQEMAIIPGNESVTPQEISATPEEPLPQQEVEASPGNTSVAEQEIVTPEELATQKAMAATSWNIPITPQEDSVASGTATATPQESLDISPQDRVTSEVGLSWTSKQWSSLLRDHNVLVLSAKVFLHCLQNSYLSLETLNLLVLDDCHLAEGDHPYVKIMSHIRQTAHADPHLLCLTAAILGSEVSDPSQLKARIHSLEMMLNSRAETSMLVISERFGCRPKESVIQCRADDDVTGMSEQLAAILLDAWTFLEDCQLPAHDVPPSKHDPLHVPKFAISECINILQTLGPWCAASIAENLISQLEKIAKHESNPTLKLFSRYTVTQLRLLVRVFEISFTPDYLVEELLRYTTPKVRELIDLLRKYKPDMDFMIITREGDEDDSISDLSDDEANDDDSFDLSSSDEEDAKDKSKHIHVAVKKKEKEESDNPFEEEKKLSGVVFVDNRYVAFALNKMVEEVCAWDENLCFVKSAHITGQGIHRSDGKKDLSKASRKQEEVLRKFRMQERNLLISTSVLEEGVDIPKCNLVVRFDPPQDYRSYTLSKGRARARDAEYVILVDEDLMEDFAEEIQTFKGIEQVLIGAGRGRKDLEDAQQVDQLDHLEFTPLPTFCPLDQPGAPSVSMKTAISLVNRYCAKLPSDAFTHLTPHCRVCPSPSDPSQFVAYLRLPVNSPIKEELQGAEMPSRQLAKMAVALEMCQLLYKAGELDSHLQPVGKEMFVCEEEEEWEEEEEGVGQGRPGTTKRKQYYIKKTADAFVSSGPKIREDCFLYSITMKLTGPITEDQNTRGRKIYAPEDSPQSFGILLSSQIPHVPSFPVYTRSGEVTVWLDLMKEGHYSDDQLEKLVGFHHFVFSSVLHLEKDPMLFCPDAASVGLLIVPLNTHPDGEVDIEWSFVEQVNQKTVIQKRNVFDGNRQIFHFQQQQFEDAVVMPSYRNMDQPQHFYVAEIRQDLSPLSPFPSPELYKTFAAYYTTKYGLTLTNTDQPLLDVDHTSARLNLLTPRYMNQKGRALPTSSLETKRARRENLQQKQILVPELCDIHIFSASLWRKAVCLPAILYRMNYLLLAEELRGQIAKDTGIGKVDLDPDFRFPRLDFGFETKPEKLQLAGQTDSQTDVNHQDTGKSQAIAGISSVGIQETAETLDVNTEKEVETLSASSEIVTERSGGATEKERDKSDDSKEESQENDMKTEVKMKKDQAVEQTSQTMTGNIKAHCQPLPVSLEGGKRAEVGTGRGAASCDVSPDEDRTDNGASSDSDSGVVLSESEGGAQSGAASVGTDGRNGVDGTTQPLPESTDLDAKTAPHTDTSHTTGHHINASTVTVDIPHSHTSHTETSSHTITMHAASFTSHTAPLHKRLPDLGAQRGRHMAGGAGCEDGVCGTDTGSSERPCIDSEESDVFFTPSTSRTPSPVPSDSDHSVYEDALDLVSDSALALSHSVDDSCLNSFSSPATHHVCENGFNQSRSSAAVIPQMYSERFRDICPIVQTLACDRDITHQMCQFLCLNCRSSASKCLHSQTTVSRRIDSLVSGSTCSAHSCRLAADTRADAGPVNHISSFSEPVSGTSTHHSHSVLECLSASAVLHSDSTECCSRSCDGSSSCGCSLSSDSMSGSMEQHPEHQDMAQSGQGSDRQLCPCCTKPESCSVSPPSFTSPCPSTQPAVGNTCVSSPGLPTPATVGSACSNHSVSSPVITTAEPSKHLTPDHKRKVIVEDCEDTQDDSSKVTVEECDDFLDITGTSSSKKWFPSHSVNLPVDPEISPFMLPKDRVRITFDAVGQGSESELDKNWAHTGTTSSSGVEWGLGENLTTFEVSNTLAETPDLESQTSPVYTAEPPQSTRSSHTLPQTQDNSSSNLQSTRSSETYISETSVCTEQIIGTDSRHKVQVDGEVHTGSNSFCPLGHSASTGVEHTESNIELVSVSHKEDEPVTYMELTSEAVGMGFPCLVTEENFSNTEAIDKTCSLPCNENHVPCDINKQTTATCDTEEQEGDPVTTSSSLDSCVGGVQPVTEHTNKSSELPVTLLDTEHIDQSSETTEADFCEENGWGSEEARPISEWCQLLYNRSDSSLNPCAEDWLEEEEEELKENEQVSSVMESHLFSVNNTQVMHTSTGKLHAAHEDNDVSSETNHMAHSDTQTNSTKPKDTQDTAHRGTHKDSDRPRDTQLHVNTDVLEEGKTGRSDPNPSPSSPHTAGSKQLPILQHSSSLGQGSQASTFDIGTWNRENRTPSGQQSVQEEVKEGAEGGGELIRLDVDEDLASFVGPSPCLLLQALTMSNANDFFSLERLETIGDSFLKYAITVYLYCTYPATHEGKLSYLRSKQVSNYNLYRLGRKKGLAERMVSSKFEPYENWLPPCYIISEDRRRGPVPKVVIATSNPKLSEAAPVNFLLEEEETESEADQKKETEAFQQELAEIDQQQEQDQQRELSGGSHKQAMIPYSLQLHHGIPDKSVADCVEALIGCYLTTCGKQAALTFMAWLGLKVLPRRRPPKADDSEGKAGVFPELPCPPSPLLCSVQDAPQLLEHLLEGYEEFEARIQYHFRDRSYLLQAFTHASYHYNYITDCYQRLEFLGDAILDYVITRHLYEDSHRYSPGILTDLRSALVNNNIFAALAVKWDFHKFFKAISPSLFIVIDKFVVRQKERQDEIDEIEEVKTPRKPETDEEEEGETEGKENVSGEVVAEPVEIKEEEVELEIPKALGDIFESVAGAIYLDSGMSLDAVWRVYYRMMKPHIDKYLKDIPKSPVRELLEMEPETAKFEKPERTLEGKIRVTVNVVGKGVFCGVGRNYRIAKSAAAKKALRFIRNLQMEGQA